MQNNKEIQDLIGECPILIEQEKLDEIAEVVEIHFNPVVEKRYVSLVELTADLEEKIKKKWKPVAEKTKRIGTLYCVYYTPPAMEVKKNLREKVQHHQDEYIKQVKNKQAEWLEEKIAEVTAEFELREKAKIQQKQADFKNSLLKMLQE